MAVSTKFTDAAAYQAYVEDFYDSLLSRAFHGNPTSLLAMPHEGVKGKLVLTQLILGQMAQRWSKDFTPIADTVDFKPRTLDVYKAKVDLSFCPQDFESTYLGSQRRPGQNPGSDLPFEGYILEAVMRKHAEELEMAQWGAVYDSTPDASDPLIELFNGYKKIIADEITATNLTPVAVSGGAWTLANVIPTLETMWDGLHDALKVSEVNVYCSYAIYKLYNQAYRADYGKYTDNVQGGRTKLDFANAYLTPVPGLTGSNRVIMTPAWNLHYGYDLASDKDSFQFEQNKRVMDFWLDYTIGVQIGIVRNDHIRVNDLA